MEKYKKITYIAVSSVIILLLGYFFFRYAFGIILPFLVSFLVVALSRPIINKIYKKTTLPKPIVSIFVLSMMLILTGACIFGLAFITVNQLASITEKIINNLSGEQNYVSMLFDFVTMVEEKLPFVSKIFPNDEDLYSLVINMLLDGAKAVSLRLTSFLASSIAALPNIAVTAIVVALSLFYFAKDYDKIGNRIIEILPPRLGRITLIFKNDVLLVVSKYLKSYLILLLITFLELIFGFFILGLENAFILAVIIALVDMLPILGAGTVLVPWSIVMLALGDVKSAIIIFILAGVTYFSRQILEPKILSKQMNIHPLLMLLSMYAGVKLAGLWGLILAPIVAFIVKITLDRMKNEKSVEKRESL